MTENLRRVDKPAVLAEVARQAVPLLERASHLRRAPDAQDDFGIETQLVEDLMPQWQQAGGARVLETEWRSRGQFLLEKADDLAPAEDMRAQGGAAAVHSEHHDKRRPLGRSGLGVARGARRPNPHARGIG